MKACGVNFRVFLYVFYRLHGHIKHIQVHTKTRLHIRIYKYIWLDFWTRICSISHRFIRLWKGFIHTTFLFWTPTWRIAARHFLVDNFVLIFGSVLTPFCDRFRPITVVFIWDIRYILPSHLALIYSLCNDSFMSTFRYMLIA